MVVSRQNERLGRQNENVNMNIKVDCLNDGAGKSSTHSGPRKAATGINVAPLGGRTQATAASAKAVDTKKDVASKGDDQARQSERLSAAVASMLQQSAEQSTSGSRCDDSCSVNSQARMGASRMMPSSAELQRMYMEGKRRELAEMRRKNEKSMHDAIHYPDVRPGATKNKRRPLTVPKEFNLSCPSTPARSRSNSVGSNLSDFEDGAWASSSRRRRSSSMQGTPLNSRRRLTVSQGPELRTALRPRSVSRQRASSRTPESSPATWHRTLRRDPSQDAQDQDTAGMSASLRSRDPWRVTSSRSQSRRPSLSPARSAFGQNTMMVTPQRGRSQRGDDPGSVRSINSDMELSVAASSVDSRCSRLSQRSCSRRCLSSEEIEQIRIEAKRQEVKNLMRHNEKTCREAFICPSSTPGVHRSLSLTIPKEFNLSCPATPARSFISDAASDGEDGDWSRSLRRPSAPPSPARSWHPTLTVPEAPLLRTACRSRSTSRSRSETPSRRSMSQHRFPREQAAIQYHLERYAAARSSDEMATPRRRAQDQEVQQRRADNLNGNATVVDDPNVVATGEFNAVRQRLDYTDALEPPVDAHTAELGQQATDQGAPAVDEAPLAQVPTSAEEADETAVPVVQAAKAEAEETAEPMLQAPQAEAEEIASPVAQDISQPPPGADLDQWVRESANPQERAQRARRVAELKVAQRQADDKARLAVFKTSSSATAASFRRDGHRFATRSAPHSSNLQKGNSKRGGAACTAFKSATQKNSKSREPSR